MKYFIPFLLFIVSGCSSQSEPDKPTEVKIEQTGSSFQLFVNEEPFYVKGAGGNENLDLLAAYGGNSIRTWSTDGAREILDLAYKHGIMVTLGLWVEHERHGFNYDNDEAVQAQLEKFTEQVQTFKDHPALLMWAIGNEMELNASNMNVWYAINNIAQMIKENDPNHPTLTVVAEVDQQKIQYLKERVPDIDLLGVNSYGGIGSLPDRLRRFGWEKPYLVTEWGPNGHWEVASTNWGAPIEQNSSEKAVIYQKRYEEVITADTEMCLGSYVFLWGQKQERTSTWYGMFLDSGEETESIDAMHYVWSGKWPENRVPQISNLTLNDRSSTNSVRIELGKVGTGKVIANDLENDNLDYEWVITPESTDLGTGGDTERRPGEIEGLIISNDNQGNVSFSTPEEPGAYRLFAYVFDGNNNAGTANIPFYVYE